MRERVAVAKASYDAATAEWWASKGDWLELEAEKSRRLIRFIVATQQRLVALMVEEGELPGSRVRSRLIHPYVAGYLSGLANNWCDENRFESGDERCQAEMKFVFREVFGDDQDDSAMTIFFERWSGEVEFVDGMMHAHEDVSSFRRWERGIRIHPRMRLYEHLTA